MTEESTISGVDLDLSLEEHELVGKHVGETTQAQRRAMTSAGAGRRCCTG